MSHERGTTATATGAWWAGLLPASYNFVALLALPFLLGATLVKHVRRGRLRAGWSERLGVLPDRLVSLCRGREVIWVHAVSVGETAAAKPLLAALRRRRPRAVILLSQVTETGRQTAQSAGADALFYLPLDLPWVVDRVLDQLRPRLLVTIDTELWPNLFWRCRARGVRVAVANGRISDRSFGRIRRWGAAGVYRWVLANTDALLMQSERDAERARYLGGERVSLTGNLKSDEAFPEVDAAALARWQATLGLRPAEDVLLAGSTGPGEEAILLDACAQLPDLRLVLVPRAIDRAAEVIGLCESRGRPALRRSELPARAAESLASRAVVVVDTIGELAQLFAVGTITFVGRSLVPLGGSNVLQAAAQARPVLSGPHVANVRDSVALLTDAGVCRLVRDADELAAALERWLRDPAERRRVGARAREVVLAGRGATDRTADALVALL
jgi:3-deoxy-D-manno-octulosonic-acid transferase